MTKEAASTSAFESESFGQDVSFKLEQPVGSMSISPCGRDVVLASREGLHIIDLDSPYDPPRYLPHHTSWEVADVQWSPFAARDNWVASTSNQKALVWNLDAPASDPFQEILHGHTRAITDINFSAHDPNVLATCAVDSFVHCWDLRSPSRPAVSFSDWFAGATQVKWSRQDSHVIASAHDRYLRIWDDRKGAYPVRSIEAHGTKIYGIDWNRFHDNRIVTCSLDKTVKFWDCNNLEDVPERVIETPFPVWRARHTPFGWGLLAMPQRGNGDLHLYDRRPKDSGRVPPVTVFPGHKGQVKEFLWRARGTIENGIDHRDFQLVSWGTDKELRLHKIDPETNIGIGYEKGVSETQRLNFTRKGARYRTFRDEPTDPESPISQVSRLDSPSTSGLPFKFRPRTYTNIGMNKVSLPQFRGWVQGGNRSRIGMHGKSNIQHDMNPIDWMKNVKFTSSWDQDTLAEEITQVGKKFPKVDFETVDIQSRRATISMQGQWSGQNTSIYMRIDMRFPKLYPREASANFSIQKTAAMTETLLETLTSDVKTIAESYASRRKGCLEAILRYLLREQTKDQIVSWVLNESIMDSKLLQGPDLAGEYSSSDDDDDDRIDGFNDPSGIRDPADLLNVNARVPVAKGCGALWSDSGKLVCFFPPKETEPVSFFDALSVKGKGDLRSGKVSGGFGHLQTESINSKSMIGPRTADDDEDSNASDASSTASSESSKSDMLSSMPLGFLPKQAWHMSASGLQRSRSADHSNHSTNGLVRVASGANGPSNVVSIKAYDDLIPSKRELALGYKIFGSGPDVCEHNAQVALKADNEVIASVWRLAKLILQNQVPLECHQDIKSGQSIVSIAKLTSSPPKRKDSGIDLSHDNQIESRKLAIKGRVRWGNSPLASRYLIPQLFEHFEKLGDVQMLAMLSCVFAEPKAFDADTLMQSYQDHDLSMQLKAPAFSIDYFPSVDVARSVIDSIITTNSKNMILIPPVVLSTGASTSVSPNLPQDDQDAAKGDSFSRHRSDIQSFDMRQSSRLASIPGHEVIVSSPPSPNSTPISLSTSPEESRMSRRSNSSLAFSFSRASLTALSQSYSHSPPTNSSGSGITSSLKKYSPSGSLAVGGWTTSGIFGGSGSSKSSRLSQQNSGPSSEDTRASQSFASASYSASRRQRGSEAPETSRSSITSVSRGSLGTVRSRDPQANVKRKVNIKVSLQNQHEFDNDGYASVPLLKPELEWKFKSYRASYAHLLGVWEMYSLMAEVLKYDGMKSYFADTELVSGSSSSQEVHDLRIGNAKRRKTFIEASRAEAAEKKGLDVRQCCRDCGHSLAAVEKNSIPFGWHCVMNDCPAVAKKKSIRAFCTICEKVIAGLMIPCLHCGHTSCLACAEGWFGQTSSSSDLKGGGSTTDADADNSSSATERSFCPSGCGCECSMYDFVAVPYPLEPETIPEVFTEPLSRQESHASSRSQRLMSEHGPDTAITAYLALSRTRSMSAAKENSPQERPQRGNSVVDDEDLGSRPDEELNPWSRSRYSSLGRGVGAGLSKGLSNKSSNSTIRKGTGR